MIFRSCIKSAIATLLIVSIVGTLSGPVSAASSTDLLNPVCLSDSVQRQPIENRPSICKDNVTQADAKNPIFGPNGILTKVIKILGLIIGIAAVLAIIISALRLTISAGDSNAVAGARRSLLYAIIGLTLAVVAEALVGFILDKL
ncbi:MAG: hypothetical protein NVS1B7_1780 [Candidatus Saccharimonadales bacterium]